MANEANKIKTLSQLIDGSIDDLQSNKQRLILMAKEFEKNIQINLISDAIQLNEGMPQFTVGEWNSFLNDEKVATFLDTISRTKTALEARRLMISLNEKLLSSKRSEKLTSGEYNWFKQNWVEWNKNGMKALGGNKIIYVYNTYSIDDFSSKKEEERFKKFKLIFTEFRTEKKYNITRVSQSWGKDLHNCYIFNDTEEDHEWIENEIEKIKIMFSLVGEITKEEI